jgi:WD40 repeat protein
MAVGSYSGHLLMFTSGPGGVKYQNMIKAHENAIKGIANDGRRLFSGCADGELGIFEISTLERIKKIENAHDGILNDTCVFRDGFATVSRDLTLRLWTEDGARIIPSRHRFSIKCVASNADGNLIATGSYGGTVDVFDVEAGTWLGSVSRPTAAGVSSLTWHEGRCVFLAASYDGNVYPVFADRGLKTAA